MRPQQPRPISASDECAGFASGELALDRYLTDRALANHLADLARCYVSTGADGRTVVAYYTLSAIAIERAGLPGRVRRNAPDPVPAVLLGRLAVATVAQGAGLGRFLVRDAVLSTLAAAETIGVRVMLVHALHDQAAAFYQSLGCEPSPTDPRHLFLLLSDARKSLESD